MTAMLDSLRPADSARSAETTQHRRPTSKDILAGGYNCQREIPEPVECEFCGRKLYHEALVMGRTVLMFAPFPQRCTCDRAKAKWAEADAEEARQKAEAEKEAAQAKRRAKIERLLGRSGIKKRFQQRTFVNFIRDTPERRRCYDTAKTYADSFPQRAERGEGLYIEGTYGTGKTHLAAAIALQLIGCGVPVVCKTSGDLLADIKEAFDSGDATEYEILKAYKTVDLLIVDTPTSKSSSRSGSMLARTHSRATGTTLYPRHLSARAQPESCTPAAISRRATGLASTCTRSPASRLRPGSTQRPSSSNRAKRPLTCLHRSGAAHRTRSTPAQAWLRAAERPQT